MRHYTKYLLPLLLLLIACGGSTEPTPTSKLFPVVEIAADTIDVVGEISAITVRVYDAVEAVNLPQVAVTFHVTGGDGSVFSGVALTNAQGQVFESWTLGHTAGEQKLEARAVVQGIPTVFGIVTKQVRPDTVTQLPVDTAEVRLMVGDTVRLSTRIGQARDTWGNAVPGYRPNVVVVGASGTPLHGDTLFAVTADSFTVHVQYAGKLSVIPVKVYPAYLTAYTYAVNYNCDSVLGFLSPHGFTGYSNVTFTGVNDSLVLQGSPSYSNHVGGAYQLFLTFQQTIVWSNGDTLQAVVHRQVGITYYAVDSVSMVYAAASLGTMIRQPNNDLIGGNFCRLTSDQFLHTSPVVWVKQ